MAGNADQAVWPLPTNTFAISLDGVEDDVVFHEVTGLDAHLEPLTEGGASAPAHLSEVSMPSTLTLRHGALVKNSKFLDWFTQMKVGLLNQQNLTVRLLEKGGAAQGSWRLTNAFPKRIEGTDFDAEGGDVTVEVLEVSYESLERLS